MKLLSCNIQQGGGKRAHEIVAAIRNHAPDIIALSEYRSAPGMALCQMLADGGWSYLECTSPMGRDNGVCVVSRTPLRRRPPSPPPRENADRWLDVDLPTYGFGLGVVHILCAVAGLKEPSRAAKTRFWEAVISSAQARHAEPFVFVGDLNTGAHRIDEVGKTFVCAEQFGGMTALGWTDLWRHSIPVRPSTLGIPRGKAEGAGTVSG